MKKDYLYPLIIGCITAFFVRLILINNEAVHLPIPLWSLFVILPIIECAAYIIASKLFSHILFLRQLGRFGIVGFMNFSVDTGIVTTLNVATGIVKGPLIIPLNIASTAVAIVNSYFWQRRWTFSEKAPPTQQEFVNFLTVTLIGLGINSLLVYVLTTIIPPFNGVTPIRLVTASKILATLVSLFWNFLGYKFFVFK